MKAFILCAGYGKRLQSLTFRLPKPLVSVWGKPVVSHIIDRLKYYGVRLFVVNTHHLADKLERYLLTRHSDTNIVFSREERLLDTGGALKKAQVFLSNDTFIIHNGDILVDFDMKRVIEDHIQNKNDVTLVVMKRESSRKLCFDKNMCLRGWINEKSGLSKGFVEKTDRYAYLGVSVASPSIFNFMPKEDVFGVFDFYIQNIDNLKIKGLCVEVRFWYDIGDVDRLIAARNEPRLFS